MNYYKNRSNIFLVSIKLLNFVYSIYKKYLYVLENNTEPNYFFLYMLEWTSIYKFWIFSEKFCLTIKVKFLLFEWNIRLFEKAFLVNDKRIRLLWKWFPIYIKVSSIYAFRLLIIYLSVTTSKISCNWSEGTKLLWKKILNFHCLLYIPQNL
jgi:hypothetical protein